MRRTYVIGLGLGATVLLGAFQNCGKLGFSTGGSKGSSGTAGILGATSSSFGNFACGSYQELGTATDGSLNDVPARADDGACYYTKVFDAVADDQAAVPDPDLGGSFGRMAARVLTVTMRGERSVELSSSVILPAPVDIAGVLIGGLYTAGTLPDASDVFYVTGSKACGVDNGSLKPPTISFGGASLAITPAIDLLKVNGATDLNTPLRLEVRAESCGHGHVSNVFAIFR